MAKTIIIGILLVGCILLFIWRVVDSGAGSERIADLEQTIERYRESTVRFEEGNLQFENTIEELQKERDWFVANNKQLEKTINRLSEIESGSEKAISDARETSERLRELSEKITN